MQDEVELNTKKLKHQRIQQEQRKFRNLESDQKYYTDEVVILIKKQKGTIDKMQKENVSLKDLITKLYEKNGQINHTAQLEDTNKIQFLKENIKDEKEKQEQTKAHINNFQKKIVEKKNYFGGYNSGSQNQMNYQKQIRILQNRLDKANQKYNQAIAFNRQLKSNIEGLRKQRKIFDALYEKLEKELQNKRKSMANIIEKTNNAYQQRDRANYNAELLKQQSKKQTGQFQKQLKELSHILLKSKLSANLTLNPKKQQNNKVATLYEQSNAKVLSKSLKEMRNKMQVVNSQKIQKYREDFAKIEAATQVQNFKDLIKIFIENQQKNFKIFRYINEQSNQIQQLTESITLLKSQIAQHQQLVKNPLEQKQSYIQELKDKLKQQTKNLQNQEQTYKKVNRNITNIIAHVETLFNTLQCDRDVAKQLSGTKIISDSNMVVFLAIIQEKILKLVKIYQTKMKQASISDNEQQVDRHRKVGDRKSLIVKKSPQHLLMMQSSDDEQQQINKLMTYDDFMKKASQKIYEQNQKKKGKSTRNKKKKLDYKMY